MLSSGNCNPRNKAVLREVKNSKSPNKGKFFWKCEVYPYCDFFLWYDDAKLRQTGLPSTAVEEPVAQPKTPSSKQRPLTSFFESSKTPSTRHQDPISSTDSGSEEFEDMPGPSTKAPATATPSSKRKRDAVEDPDSFSDMDSDEERQLAALADNSARKAAGQGKAPATPATGRTLDPVSGIPTPSVSRTLFPGAESSSKRQKTVSFEDASAGGISTPASKRADAPAAGTPASGSGDEDINEEVMRLLRAKNLDAATLTSVEGLLAKAARRTRGLAMGRDSTRAMLRDKDGKIAQLQGRVAALETKDKMHQSQITNMKANLMRVYQDN